MSQTAKKQPDKPAAPSKKATHEEVQHLSSCAVCNAPAFEPGPCDCGAVKAEQLSRAS